MIAICSIMSCTKELEIKEKPISFVAGIDSTRTTISSEGKVAWVIGDQVTISNGTQTGIYKVASVGNNRFANLEYVSGTQFATADTYTASYGDVNNQWYDVSSAGSNCPMEAGAVSAESGSTCKFAFTNSCGVVAVTANTGDIKIAAIKVGNKSLNFANPITLNGTYMVAEPAGETFSSVSFVQADGSIASKVITGASVAKNEIRNLDTKSFFSVASKYSGSSPIALPGIFSVSATKKVKFSRGLVCTDGAATPTISYSGNQLEDRQYNSAFNTAGMNSISIPEGWAMLTKDEWNYLFYTRAVDSEITGIDISKQGHPVTTYTNLRLTSGVVEDSLSTKGVKYGVFVYPDYFRFPQDIADKITQWEKDNRQTSSTKLFYKYINYSVAGNVWSDKFVFTKEDFIKLQNLGVVFLGAFGRYQGTGIPAGNENTAFMMYPNTGSGDDNALSITYAYVNINNWHGTVNKGNIRLTTTAE